MKDVLDTLKKAIEEGQAKDAVGRSRPPSTRGPSRGRSCGT